MIFKILIVDDEQKILKALERQLTNSNIKIITKSTAEEAKELLKNTVIDILITDQKMPGSNGLKLVKLFKELSPDTVSILMSSFIDVEAMISAINDGHIFHFIQKPWDEKELIEAVNMAIEFKKKSIYQKQIVKSYLMDKDKWMAATSIFKEKEVKNEENLISVFKKIMDVKDRELYLHCQRVAEMAVEFSSILGIRDEKLEEIKQAAEFHDLGKIVIKDSILYKESRLSTDEYEEMKRHPVVGAEVLSEIESLKKIAYIVEQHHERLDGHGYPKGLKQEEICFEAKIIAILDVYDALTSERVYKKSKTKQEAMEIMKKGGIGQFDAKIFEKFQNYI